MERVIQYIRNDDKIKGYPSVLEQMEIVNEYSKENNFYSVKTFVDPDSFLQTKIYEAIMFCLENRVNNVLMYNYKTLSHKSIDRVSISKLLYEHNIKIHFATNSIL